TTRPDTIFGATYLVLAPEHAFVSEQIRNPKSEIRNKSEIEKYVNEAQAKTELERQADQKGKTGVELRGVKAINPATNEEIPVWVADYVLGGYGTGAIMAVPAHDGRDFEFAKKFSLPMRVVVKASSDYADMDQVKLEEFAKEIVKLAKDKDFQATLVGGMARSAYENGRFGLHSDADIFVDRKGWEIIGDYLKEKGFDVKSNSGSEKMPGSHSWENHQWFWRDGSGVWLDMFLLEEENGVYFDNVGSQKLIWGDKTALRSLTVNDFEFTVPSKELLEQISQNLSNSWDKCFMDSGILTNSGEFSGMKSEEARAKMTEKFGTPKVQYKLRDWVFSRQRYWGEPIPLIYCAACAQKSKGSSNNQTPNSKHDRKDFSEGERQNPGWFAVPDEELPVELPKVENYQPRDDGESPLASVEEWVNTKCPKCDGPAKRETDTMPNWAGSSWYFLGYCIAENLNNQALISKQVKSKEIQDAWKYFMPVDWYNGGMEHVTLHLLYSRFWNMVLHDLGFVPNGEPYKKRTAQGMILAEGGVKMSKSKGNVINPNELVEKFGADAVRLYEMFIGPFDQAVAWDKRGILGPARFLEKVWRVGQSSPDSSLSASGGAAQNDKLRRLLHKTIKKVSDDIEAMSFNTAISSMMEFINEVAGPVIPASEPPARNASPSEAGGESRSRIKSGMTNDISGMTISRGDFKKFLQLLAPFAPHITSELYEKMGGENIDFQKWPEHDASLMLEDSFDLVVQVNGKTRGTINVASGINEQEAEALVRASEIGKKWLGGELKKVIYVPDRLINFIV
ncbi:MAG: class I tRNA ligase family protein, partial [bacterium]|nr:class I tRNA ligase family protein [bacterium]